MSSKTTKITTRNKMLAALARWANKELGKAELPDGEYPIELTIEGTVDGVEIGDACLGTLRQGGQQPYNSSTSVPATHVMARLWALLPKTRQKHVVGDLLDEFRLEGTLEVDEEVVKQFESLLPQLRSFTNATRRGACSFEQRTLDAA